MGQTVIRVFSLFLLANLVFLAGCAKKTENNAVGDGQNENKNKTAETKTAKGDIGSDTCAEFSADFVYSASGKAVVKVEPDFMVPQAACRYYFTYDPNFYKEMDNPILRAGGAHIFVMQENMDVAKQKKGVELLGATTKTDGRILMENMITLRKDGSIWDIKLIINSNRYVRMNDSNKAMTDEELIDFAAKMADKIMGQSPLAIKKNPVELLPNEDRGLPAGDKEKTQPGASQVAVAKNFFAILADKKPDQALAELDMNEPTKAMWQANFKNIMSLKVNSLEPVFMEEWTAETQKFKAVLDLSVTPEGEGYGYVNGENFRWLTLKLNNGRWLISEIASNP